MPPVLHCRHGRRGRHRTNGAIPWRANVHSGRAAQDCRLPVCQHRRDPNRSRRVGPAHPRGHVAAAILVQNCRLGPRLAAVSRRVPEHSGMERVAFAVRTSSHAQSRSYPNQRANRPAALPTVGPATYSSSHALRPQRTSSTGHEDQCGCSIANLHGTRGRLGRRGPGQCR